MTDNKTIAAVLTSGRLATVEGGGGLSVDQWVSEYKAFLAALDNDDAAVKKQKSREYTENLKKALE